MKLRDKVAIVTGAGSGIGRESALLFASHGAKVVVVDIVEDAGYKTARMIGDGATFCKADVSCWKDTEQMVRIAMERFGRLDILFNNAGISMPERTTVVDTKESDWDKVLAVNLKSVFLGVRHALPVMMQQESGVILNTASQAGLGAGRQLSSYCASKGGIVALTRQLAVDYASYNIRVNSICPSTLETAMGAAQARQQQSESFLRQRHRLVEKIPMRRFCTTRDVAQAALYLASDESTYVTGISLLVDGGALAV